ncbi:MAG: D-cysteine desulfhydrase family protein [Firmicutes bacterium]|nr:D-cysteine desulfhydrase family protein [Bacillota bacterium]MBR3749052.1 D-cysteine desulfhydrase family protein [Bacillota bacterium]MBR4143746.1 D-cysteine desulfhydrase family protein [Bacillota bacterium]MBR6970658.1 D-cysteine desulfhydrase family protein [Bacillota bacterium]
MKKIEDFPRIPLAVLPTPIQKLENISRILGTNVYIKRDDMTGIGLGGNKVRKLEFLLADAKNKGAEIVFTTGGAQSNHAMLTAACCKKLGLTPILILKKRGVTDRKGNILLEYLMNTDVRFLDTSDSADVYREMDRVGQESGKVYYKIPTGGSNALGALGYVNCVKEISEQTDIKFDYICCAEGSGGTHAGVAMGAKLFMPDTKVIGMMVDTDPFEEITTNIMKGLAELLELDFVPTVDDVHLVDVCGEGYAIASPEGNAAIRMMAENEGLFLDPVYTGKAFGGLIKMAREGKFGPDDNILYLYSGGAGGLFAIDVNLD